MYNKAMRNCAKILAAITLLLAAAFAAFGSEAAPNPPRDVYAKNGMVSSSRDLASQAGAEIMQKGGNAIDAAVATALALHVVEPYNIGMGGGGFATIRFAETGEVVFVDFRETAPASARKDMFASEQAKKEQWASAGGRAVAVPGYVAGWFYMLDKYGTMSFAEVAEPAIRLAEEGYVWSESQYGFLTTGDQYAKLYEINGEDGNVPFFQDGLPLPPGEVIKQPGLAEAFRLLGKEGPKAFYGGPIGEALVKKVNAAGGEMTMQDLLDYKVVVRKPVEGTYRGYKIYSSAPSSSGGAHIIQLLNYMENFDVTAMDMKSPEYFDVWGKGMRMVYADRAKYMADDAFVTVPLVGLTSKEYAKTMFERYDAAANLPERGEAGDPWHFDGASEKTVQDGVRAEHLQTSHFSTVDKAGNIVAATNSINDWFGSKVVVPEYQLLLNSTMEDFAQDPESVNAPQPKMRPLSSMSPTIILDPQGRPYMTVGAAGGSRILAIVSQVISHVIDHGMTMSEAVEAPRLWTTIEGQTTLEAPAGQEVIDALNAKGYNIDIHAAYHGVCQGIIFDHEKNIMEAAADQRIESALPAGF